MPGGVSPPPMPPKIALVVCGAACILVGIVLLVRGRANGRALLALAAAALAAALSPLIVEFVPPNPWLAGAAAAATAGLFAFVLGRVLWAVVFGAILCVGALTVVAGIYAAQIDPAPAWAETPTPDFTTWCGQLAAFARQWVGALWQHRSAATAAAAAAAAIGVAVGLLMPRLTLLVASSIVGAAGAVGGAALLLWAAEAHWARPWAQKPLVPALAAGVLALIGVGLQARSEMRPREPKATPEPAQEAGQ